MDKKLKAETGIEIRASAKSVWMALTDPDKIKTYLFGTNTRTNWKEGSEIVFEGEYQGHKYRDHGTIVQLQAEKVLQYTYWSNMSQLEDKPENYSLVGFFLEPGAEGVYLRLIQEGFVNEEGREHSEKAWTSILDQIKGLVEKG